MSDPTAFFARYSSQAQQASAATGVAPSVILAQWADETAYGTSSAFVSGHNFAGVSYGGYVNGFPSEQVGLNAYIAVLNQSNFASVRSAKGATAQATALGNSPWAASHYDASGGGPGSDLLSIISANNLARYDTGFSAPSLPSPVNTRPTNGLSSSLTLDSIILNGQSLTVDVSAAVTDCSIDLSINGASTLRLSMTDPHGDLLNSGLFSQVCTIFIDSLWFEFVAVAKQGYSITAIFESWTVAQLRKINGAFTVAPNTMTRVDFAKALLGNTSAPWNGPGWGIGAPGAAELAALGYSLTQEPLSRGTIDTPLEDTWTCLQRLANEVQWRCFESGGVVFFGPDSWFETANGSSFQLAEYTAGVDSIDGEYDVGQPIAQVTFNVVADNWSAQPGQVARISSLGPFNGAWLVAEITKSLFLLDATVTLEQAQPSLPEPVTGGSQAAVGVGFGQQGNQQSANGTAAATQAIAYANAQLGKPYIWGGENPATGFDCSGLAQAAYASAGISIPRVAQDQFNAGPSVPAGSDNLRPGDLVFFGTSSSNVTHVGIYIGNGQMINAENSSLPIRVDDIPTTVGGSWGSDIYVGATRPAE